MPVELSFDLNLGSLFSPLLLVVLAWIVNAAKKANDKRVDERHAETKGMLTEITSQVRATNGRVTTLETDYRADHDTLLSLKGSVETLLKLKGEAPQ